MAKGTRSPFRPGRHIRPYALVRAWLDAAGITSGPLFVAIRRGDHPTTARLSAVTVARIVKRYARAAGLEAADFAGHSLRSGFATSAVEAGADLKAICTVTRHKSLTTLLGYVRRRDSFKQHPGEKFL